MEASSTSKSPQAADSEKTANAAIARNAHEHDAQ
jgi:hypothetical protein